MRSIIRRRWSPFSSQPKNHWWIFGDSAQASGCCYGGVWREKAGDNHLRQQWNHRTRGSMKEPNVELKLWRYSELNWSLLQINFPTKKKETIYLIVKPVSAFSLPFALTKNNFACWPSSQTGWYRTRIPLSLDPKQLRTASRTYRSWLDYCTPSLFLALFTFSSSSSGTFAQPTNQPTNLSCTLDAANLFTFEQTIECQEKDPRQKHHGVRIRIRRPQSAED